MLYGQSVIQMHINATMTSISLFEHTDIIYPRDGKYFTVFSTGYTPRAACSCQSTSTCFGQTDHVCTEIKSWHATIDPSIRPAHQSRIKISNINNRSNCNFASIINALLWLITIALLYSVCELLVQPAPIELMYNQITKAKQCFETEQYNNTILCPVERILCTNVIYWYANYMQILFILFYFENSSLNTKSMHIKQKSRHIKKPCSPTGPRRSWALTQSPTLENHCSLFTLKDI